MSPSFKRCNEALGFVKGRVLLDQLCKCSCEKILRYVVVHEDTKSFGLY